METLVNKKALKGGEFLIRDTDAQHVFIPEDFTEEQRMIAKTCQDFVDKEVLPVVEVLDAMKDPSLMPSLLDKSGELGLLGTSIPEEYGGFGMDFNTSMLVADYIGGAHSFAVALSAHTGIGTLPILYYGNDDQKRQYLPKLATGEWKAAYCLTEPDSGSDANAAKTKAVLSDDGKHYLITGQKMWITNGGFADLFIVFARIEDDKYLTAFIVERSYGGITMNEEEKKMGIKGSSTRQMFFNDCPVPVENMLSERQNGFKIAVNILNIGRIKLAAACLGAARRTMNLSINYANERKQFGQSISQFGAIKQKIAQMATRFYASEAAAYRAGQNIDDSYESLVADGMSMAEAKLKSTEQFAIECALMKVHSSEVLDFTVDEGVQIYGGMGYSADAPMDRCYRDSRINRIFEGTNEINRMLSIDMILKRAFKGELDLMGPATAVGKEIMSIPDFAGNDDEGVFAAEKQVIRQLKKATLMVAGAAVQHFQMKLSQEQEVILNLADMLMETYVAESVLLRTEKLVGIRGEAAVETQTAMMRLYLYDAVEKVGRVGREAINAFATGDEQRVMLMGLKRFTKSNPFNVKDARRQVADRFISANSYDL